MIAVRSYALAAACLATFTGAPEPAAADPWAAPGDARLRHDLQLLADSGLIRAPLTAWPVSWAEIARDLGQAGDATAQSAHVGAALGRVRSALTAATRTGEWRAEGSIAGSVEPMTLRRFSDVPREEGELSGALQYTGMTFAARVQATIVADADDDKTYRPDGSYVGAVLGNWMLTAGWLDRWWGPGWEGSLILGTNHRPIPSFTIERNVSDPFKSRWLSWIGQWRLAMTYGLLDGQREDHPDAHFFGMRVTWKPHDRVEIGLSRSAQLCGDDRPCGFDTFWDMFLGRDNDQALEDQPGNQLGGYDIRWSVPWAPVAVYAQAIGEDEANSMPSKFLGLAGAEVWGGWGDRSWRAHVEYADTACGFYESEPEYGCAYRNVIYFDGYQYRDRVIGHALDGDSRQRALGVMLVNPDGSSWEFALQNADINRKGANPVHSVSAVAAKIRSADLYHRRALFSGELQLGLGYEERESADAGFEGDDIRGFVQWARQFE